MSEFHESITIHAPPQRVFEYLRDVRNMPRYAPTMTSAEPQAGGHRVRVTGAAGSHHYDADGSWQEDANAMRVAWASDGESDYSGSLTVKPAGDNSRVEARIRFSGRDDDGKPSQATPDWHASAEKGLKQALAQLKQRIETTSAE